MIETKSRSYLLIKLIKKYVIPFLRKKKLKTFLKDGNKETNHVYG